MKTGIEVFLAIVIGCGLIALNVWFVVVAVQFLRFGTRAFRRYLAVTPSPKKVEKPLASVSDISG